MIKSKCVATKEERGSCDWYKKRECLNPNECYFSLPDTEVKQASIRDSARTSPEVRKSAPSQPPDIDGTSSWVNRDGSAWVTPDKK